MKRQQYFLAVTDRNQTCTSLPCALPFGRRWPTPTPRLSYSHHEQYSILHKQQKSLPLWGGRGLDIKSVYPVIEPLTSDLLNILLSWFGNTDAFAVAFHLGATLISYACVYINALAALLASVLVSWFRTHLDLLFGRGLHPSRFSLLCDGLQVAFRYPHRDFLLDVCPVVVKNDTHHVGFNVGGDNGSGCASIVVMVDDCNFLLVVELCHFLYLLFLSVRLRVSHLLIILYHDTIQLVKPFPCEFPANRAASEKLMEVA